MYLKNLTLSNFKNHKESHFQFEKNIICFVGDNGAGKTNILDAIHYLSLSKSYFNKVDAQNINFDESFFLLKGVFANEEETEIQCSLQIGEQKQLKSNGKKYKRFSDHIGKFPIVVISPTDSNIILDGSEVRRRYIDSSIAQYNKQYLKNLIAYNKALKQRNALLKKFAEQQYFDKLSLDIFDDQLIKYGTVVFNDRTEFLKDLKVEFNKYYAKISTQNEQVAISYQSQLKEKDFKKNLEASLEKDRLNQYTNVGIHKDDIIFEMDGYPIPLLMQLQLQRHLLHHLIRLHLQSLNQWTNK